LTTLLVDHNIEGQAALIHSTLISDGWAELIPFRFITFTEAKLPFDSSDRHVWEFSQRHHFLLLTGNRNMQGEDSLEQTIRQHNHPSALPVITISDVDRVMEYTYRRKCAVKLAELALYSEDFSCAV